jgi:hypothetical protein
MKGFNFVVVGGTSIFLLFGLAVLIWAIPALTRDA